MDKNCQFSVNVTDHDRISFANLSGDHNPLHIDANYAENTDFRRCVLHGAFSAGLVSKMAGMYLPGVKCLLHSLDLKFINPIYTPVTLTVSGKVVKDNGNVGQVLVDIRDTESGQIYVEGGYKFGRHDSKFHDSEEPKSLRVNSEASFCDTSKRILVTGASGGLGSSLLKELGENGLGLSRRPKDGIVCVEDLEDIFECENIGKIGGIVHCAWPQPLKNPLLDSDGDLKILSEYHLAKPIRDCITLAKLLKERGTPGAGLILVGSVFSNPGRHAWSYPFYSLSKSLIPTLVKILALEFGASKHKVVGVNFDMLDGGMNSTISKAAKVSVMDRSPEGVIPSMDEAATNISWILNNNSSLVSGALIDLSGGNIP